MFQSLHSPRVNSDEHRLLVSLLVRAAWGRPAQSTANQVKHEASAPHETGHKRLSFKKAQEKVKNYYCKASVGLPALMPHVCTNGRISHPCVVHIT